MAVGRVRPSVTALAAYRPGKAASQAEEEHGITHAIKLASNENPYGPAPSVQAAIQAAASGVNRYSDHRAVDLRAKLAEWLGVEADQVGVGCGSVGLLQQLCLTYLDPGDEVVYPWPSFEAYPINVKLMAAVPVTTALVDHAFDLDAVVAAVTDRTKLVMLATPNNPTGTAVSTAELASMLDRVPDDVVVLVDEAYREFSDPALGDPITDLLPSYRNVVVSRTFSKAYGLAGLRTGYVVADAEIILELDKVLLAFASNMLAQVASVAVLDALDEIQPVIDLLLAERGRVASALGEMGLDLPKANANFVYIPMGERTNDVHMGLEKRGVVTRPFPGEGIRVTIGSPDENDRFLATLTEAMA
jgi:histidinol-phosphate aminotransferase